MKNNTDSEYTKQDAVTAKAAEKLGALHDILKTAGYTNRQLGLYLMRLLFCFFADDTGIFENGRFIAYILHQTKSDGSDISLHIQKIFEVLNTPEQERFNAFDVPLNLFPYSAGGLFKEPLPAAPVSSIMRKTLIECCSLEWSAISPAIFGLMLQRVMNPKKRHVLGAYYTSEATILKLIRPLFLDALWSDFNKYKHSEAETRITNLQTLHNTIASFTFLDPACGCGNFLVITYRELRLLELAVIEALQTAKRQVSDTDKQISDTGEYSKIKINQFYGIEIEEFPAQIAQTALQLTAHQMNRLTCRRLKQPFVHIPPVHSASIVQGNALTLDWETIVPKHTLSYILGNPPFLGARMMNRTQSAEIALLFQNGENAGNLDYVTGWYKKAAEYIQGTQIECAFISTNSICQGQQAPILWPRLFARGIHINFAHRTFKWYDNTKEGAEVYCIIVGFSLINRSKKHLFLYNDIKGAPQAVPVKRINAYLTDAPDVFIGSRTVPLDRVPEMGIGNKPVDNGNYLFSDDEKNEFIKREPGSEPYFKRWYGADEFINNKIRWCLWLGNCPADELKKMPHVLQRIENVRAFRRMSKSEGTRNIADTPERFHVENMPQTPYIAIPETSSEKRKYIPIGFLEPEVLCSNAMRLIPHATLYEFGILTSQMHMAWMRTVCGRLKSDYRYSARVVYNNFPWPDVTNAQKAAVVQKAHGVLRARSQFPKSALAELYDPNTMPPVLAEAHATLDAAVDALYCSTAFLDDTARAAFLFDLYVQKTRTPPIP